MLTIEEITNIHNNIRNKILQVLSIYSNQIVKDYHDYKYNYNLNMSLYKYLNIKFGYDNNDIIYELFDILVDLDKLSNSEQKNYKDIFKSYIETKYSIIKHIIINQCELFSF